MVKVAEKIAKILTQLKSLKINMGGEGGLNRSRRVTGKSKNRLTSHPLILSTQEYLSVYNSCRKDILWKTKD